MLYPELKVKVISLAQESVTIRRMERRLRKQRARASKPEHIEEHQRHLDSLHAHRVHQVRGESRLSHLAYGFLRGVPYRKMEQVVRKNNEPDWERLESMVSRFGGRRNPGEVERWRLVPSQREQVCPLLDVV
jgi:hypothetical protein